MDNPDPTTNGSPAYSPVPPLNGNGQLRRVVPNSSVPDTHHGATLSALSAAPTALILLKALRRRWLLATTFGLLTAAGVGALIWFVLPPAKLTAYTKLYMPSRPEGLIFDHPEAKTDFASFQRTQVALIKSRLVLNAALRNPKVVDLHLDAVNWRIDPVDWLEKEIKVDFPDGAELPRISMSGDDPEHVKVLVSAVTDAYLQEIVNKQTSLRQQRLDQLKEIASRYEERLKRIRDTVRELAKAVGSGDNKVLALKQELVQKQLGLAQSELVKVEADLRRMELEVTLHKSKDNGPVEISDKLIDEYILKDPVIHKHLALKGQLAEKLAEARRHYVDPDRQPLVRETVMEIAANDRALEDRRKELRPILQAQLSEKVKNDSKAQLALLSERISFHREFRQVLRDEVDRLVKDSDTLNIRSLDIEGYKLDIQQAEAGVARVHSEIDKLTVELQAPPRVTRLEEAVVSHVDELTRKLKLAGIGAVAALVLVLLGVAFLEFRSRRIDSPEDVVQGLGIPLMGTLPAPRRGLVGGLIGSGAPSDWQNLLAESVDSARTLLLRAAEVDGLKTVMITSAVSGEGKTSLATHLAASLARAGRKTLLVDGDLRSPAVHRVFDVPAGPGFCELLRGDAEMAGVVHGTAAPGLSVLPAGRCDGEAINLLAQGGVQQVFDQVKPDYDFVVVDSAPVLPVADSLQLAQHVDGVLFSLLRDVSRLPKVYTAYHRLDLLGVRLLGAVVSGSHGDVYGYAGRYALPPEV